VVTTVAPVIIALSFPIARKLIEKDSVPTASVYLLCVVLYTIAQIGIMALIIYSLTSMPAEVYQSITWIEIWPHFS